MESNLLYDLIPDPRDIDEPLILYSNHQEIANKVADRVGLPPPYVSNRKIPQDSPPHSIPDIANPHGAQLGDQNEKDSDAEPDGDDQDENEEETEWNRETRWYQHISLPDSLKNVTWHSLDHDRHQHLLESIEPESCSNTDYMIDRDKFESLHALHPNFDQIDLLPLPRNFVLFSKRTPIRGRQLTFSSNMNDHAMIKHVIQKYTPLMFDHILTDDDIESIPITSDYVDSVHLHIVDISITELHEDTDESYQMLIPHDATSCHTLYITANTVFGALHSMETLSQLIEYDFDHNYFSTKYSGHIFDFPYYKYRGVLLDTARHFYPIRTIKKFIDSLAFTKFNVLHWHIVDDQSWPFPLDKYPDLFRNASWSKQERYSAADVVDIVSYAKLNGLRVIPGLFSFGDLYVDSDWFVPS